MLPLIWVSIVLRPAEFRRL